MSIEAKARLLTSSTATLDLDSAWGATDNPWRGLTEGPEAPIPSSLQRLGYTGPVQLGALRGYMKQQPSARILIERHPLWQDDHPVWCTAVADAAARYPRFEIVPMNPFRLLRRPADYV